MAVIFIGLLSGMFALPASAAADTAGFAAEVVRLINIERANAGKPALRPGGSVLNAAALVRAKEYAADRSLTHTRPDNTMFSTVLDDHRISWTSCGENLAYGQTTPAMVVADWMNSAGHRKNILHDFDRVGVAVYESGGRLHWAQLFISEGGMAKLLQWPAWPAWAQWLVRVLFFGWIWMR